MQATETKLRKLIEGTNQYVVPLFQRPYSWGEKQWKTLWNDVYEQSRHEDGRPHFFGSIVTTPARSVPQGVGKYLLIDGQQRLTTVQVFLAAIRDAAAETGEARLRDRIDELYLTNRHEEGDERLKVLPTQADRDAFRALMRREEASAGRLRDCYRFFRSRLDKLEPAKLDRLHAAIVDRLSLVSITCDEHDNPHLIFESLNAKGEKLTPADLIRNFVLMKVHVGDQARLFGAHWLPIQEALGTHLTEFVRHFLMKEGKILQEADVYFELKDRLNYASPAEAEAFLADLHRHGRFYAKFVEPAQEVDAAVAERLDRLRRLKVTVAYPLLLRVFDAVSRGELTDGQLIEVLDLLESFVLRRSICNMPSNQLRRMLPPIFDAAGGAGPGLVDGLREQLGGKRCPGDEEFAAALAAESVYSTADKNVRLRLILERLERSFGHKEPADLAGATIEHVMPQTLTDAWRAELGDELEDGLALLHTLGNLTLSGYNAKLSNQPFAEKRRLLAGSHYELNRHFAAVEQWGPDRIRERGRLLAECALRIWPDVGRTTPVRAPRRVVFTKPPAAIRFRGVEARVRNWKDAFVRLVKEFEATSPGFLDGIAASRQFDAVISTEEGRFRRSKVRIGNLYINTHGSASQLQEWCRKLAQLAGIGATDYEFVLAGDREPD